MAQKFLTDIKLGDDVKAQFGDGGDLKIWHDLGTATSYISDQGSGDLYIQADSMIRLESYTGTEKMATFHYNGAVKLFYDNSQKFETTSAGITVTGDILSKTSDGAKLTLQTSDTTVGDGDILGRIDFQAPNEASGTDAILVGASIWAEADDTFAADNNETELVFATGSSAAATEKVRITSLGKVGLGTATPTYALEVINASYDNIAWGASSAVAILTQQGSNPAFKTVGDLDIVFYANNNLQLTIDDGTATFGGHVAVASDKQIQVGSSISAGDLKIYRDTSSNTQQILNKTGTLKINQQQNDGNIVFTNDDGAGGSFDYFSVDGGSTTHDGSATTAAYTKWPDNSRIALGTGKDLQIFHDGTNNQIRNEGGNLDFEQHVDDGSIRFYNDDGSGGVAAYFTIDGNNGFNYFPKNARFNDGVKLQLGIGADFSLFHDGTNSYMQNYATWYIQQYTGTLYIEQHADDGDIVFKSDDGSGGTTEYYRLDGGTVRNIFSKHFRLLDDVQLDIGTSDDFRIVHTSANNNTYVQNFTGDLEISNYADDKDILFRCDDGSGGLATYFYLDGSSATYSSGSYDELYTIFPDDSRLAIGSSKDTMIWHNGSDTWFDNYTGNINFRNRQDDGSIIFYSDDGSGSHAEYLRIDGTNEANLFSKNVKLSDSVELRIGTSNDLKIYHDGSHSYIQDTGTGHLQITSSQLQINSSDNSENMATFAENGAVNLYHNGVAQAGTMSDGWQVPATKGVYFDGGSHTYIKEISADRLGVYSGGRLMLDLGENGDASSYIDMHAPTVSIHSDEAEDPMLQLKNTTNDANGSKLRFTKDRGAAGQDDDLLGTIDWLGKNDAGSPENTEYARIQAQIKDASDGNEGGKLRLGVATHDGDIGYGLVLVDGNADGEVDATIGASATSLTTVAGDLSVYNKITFRYNDNHYIQSGTNNWAFKSNSGTSALLLTTGGNATFGGSITASSDITATGADLTLAHGVGTTVHLRREDTTITDGNTLATILFQGYDNDSSGAYNSGAAIIAKADGTWGASSHPGELIFQTTNTSGSLATALTLNEDQSATFAGSVSASSFTTTGNITFDSNLISEDGVINLSTSSSGHIYLRPAGGQNNTDGEFWVNSNNFEFNHYGHIRDTSNDWVLDGDGHLTTSAKLNIYARRDGVANLLNLRSKDLSNPDDALPNDQGGIVRWQGFDGTDYAQMGAIAVIADGQAVANGDAPSKMILYTVPDGTETLTPALTLDKSQNATFEGNVGVGTAPAKPLHVYSADNQPLRVESTDAYSGIEIKDNGSSTLPPLISALSDDFIFYGGHGSSRPAIMQLESTTGGMVLSGLANGKWRVNSYGAMYFRNSSNATHESYIHSRSDGSLSIGRVAESNWTGSGNNAYAATTYDHVKFDTSSNAIFAGNVGIGGAPSYELDVNKSEAGGVVDARVYNSDTSNTSSGARLISAVGGAGSGDPRLVLSVLATQEYHVGIDNSDSDKLKIGAGSTPGTTSYITMTSTGDVGIGGVSPSYPFHVEHNAGDTWTGMIYNTGAAGSADAGSGLIVRTDANASDDKMILGLYANGGYQMVFRSNGRVGIGDSAPNTKLEVNGDVTIRREGSETAGELLLGGTTDGGFVDFDGTSLQLNTQRDPNTGTFVNTSKSHASIIMTGASTDSSIKFYTTTSNNATATLRWTIDKNGALIKSGGTSSQYLMADGSVATSTFNGGTVTGDITIDKDAARLILQDDSTGNALNQWISYRDNDGTERAYVGYGSTSNQTFYVVNHLSDLMFYAGGVLNETKSGANSTFAGSVQATYITANNPSGAANGSAQETARFVNMTNGATSSYMYIGAYSGTDWRLGKNVLGTSSNSDFNITKHSGSVIAMTIDTSLQTKFQSTTDYVIGLNDSASVNQWWLKAYTNGNFAIHENGVGDKFTIAAGGNATFAGNVAVGGGALKTYHSNVTSVIELDDQASIFTRADETYIGQNIYYDSGDAGTAIEAGKGTLMRLKRGEINMYFSAAAASSADDTHSLQEKFTLTDAGNLTIAGHVATGGEFQLNSSAQIDWGNGDARIVEGDTNNYSLSFQTYDGSACNTALRLEGNNNAYLVGKLGIGTADPDGDGYSYAEDLVIKGGNSASDGAGITIACNGKTYGVIAFGDAADNNIGEIYYSHSDNSMNLRTNTDVALNLDSSGNAKIKGAVIVNNSSTISTTTTTGEYLTHQQNSHTMRLLGLSNSWCHILTTANYFYFDKGLRVDTGEIGTYNDDMQLNRQGTNFARGFANGIFQPHYLGGYDGVEGGSTGRRFITKGSGDNSIYFGCYDDNGYGYLENYNNSSGFYFNTNQGHFRFDTGSVIPYNDSEIYLGFDANRWICVYADGFNTSGQIDWTNGFSIKQGASNYGRIDNWIDMQTTGLYSSTTNGAHIYPNTYSSYASMAVSGTKNGYYGILFANIANKPHFMFDASGNGGEYHEGNGTWASYWHVSNACMGIGNSTTSSSYTIYSNGAIYSTGDVVAYSDRRAKENIVTVDNALDKVSKLRGVYYNKKDSDEKKREVGVIAQEVKEVLPEVVTYAKDVDEYGVDYGKINGLLIEAIKDLKKEIEELKQCKKCTDCDCNN